VCESGLPAAEYAALRLLEDSDVWTTLAAARYHCHDFGGAVGAAQKARALGAGAEASYYLGVALLEQGNDKEARQALNRAADLEPTSVWREYAEQKLDTAFGP
jgi:Flp pilus assembly protein TadD